jgi:carbon-monoxide dehydrogenase medium subunit
MQVVAGGGVVATSYRTLPRFKAVRAASIAEAVVALREADRPAVLAGGTDLPARFNEGFQPTHLIDISRIPDLRRISVENDCLVIGASVTHAQGSANPEVQRCIPGFASAWARIANVRIRISATLGGNVMARRTRYEGAIFLTCLDARLRVATTTGVTEQPIEAIWSGEAPRGLLTHIVIPLLPGLRLDYERSLRPIMTQALCIDAQGNGRVVTATEHVVPRVSTVVNGIPDSAFAHASYGDPVTGDAYINRVARVLADRQLARLGRNAA